MLLLIWFQSPNGVQIDLLTVLPPATIAEFQSPNGVQIDFKPIIPSAYTHPFQSPNGVQIDFAVVVEETPKITVSITKRCTD